MEEHGETITVDGLRFKMSVHQDLDVGPPWKEHDGHGIVSEWTNRAKLPGELILATDHGSHRFYDLTGTLEIAERDGWGVSDTQGKTKRQILNEAVRQDYEHLKAWCNDEWHWVTVEVELLDLEGNIVPGHSDTTGGIESDAGDYLKEVAVEMASTIAAGLKDVNYVCQQIR